MVLDEIIKIPADHRIKLVDRLSDHVLAAQGNLPGHADDALVLSVLADSLDVVSRRRIAERFARCDNAPRALIVHFARDTIKVAAPVLRWSPLVDAALLEEIVADISDGHLLIVSKRDDLSAAMTAILVDHGSHDVQISVARNAHAALSGPTLSGMIKNAVHDRQLEEVLCGRDDLPDSAATSLMTRVRRRLKTEVGPAAASLDTGELRLALRTSETEAGAEASDTKGLSLDAFVAITRLARSGNLSEQNLVTFIEQNNTGAMLMCLAKLLRLHPTIARRLVYSSESEGLLVAARAMPLGRSAFAALARFRQELVDANMTAAELIAAYESVSVEQARRIMAFHRTRRSTGSGIRSEHSTPDAWALAR